MRRKLTVEVNHILYFPYRTTSFLVEDETSAWIWERFKYLEIGTYQEVPIDFDSSEAIETQDGFLCSIKSKFVYRLNRDNLKKNIKEFTIDHPPKKELKDKISINSFKPIIIQTLKKTIKKNIETAEYIKLLENVEYKNKIRQSIREEATKELEKIYFELFDSAIKIIPLPIDESLEAKRKELREKAQKIKDEDNEQKLKDLETVNKFKEREAGLKKEAELNGKQMDREFKQKDEEDKQKREIADLTRNQKHNETKNKIEGKINELTQELNKLKAKQKENFEREKNTLEADTKEKKKEHEYKEQKKARENVLAVEKANKDLYGQQKLNLQVEKQKEDLQKELTEKKAEIRKIDGSIDSENIKLKNLAENAYNLDIQKIIFQQLPQIFEKAIKPLEKCGEIKVLQIVDGKTSDSNKEGNQIDYKSPLSLMTILPMYKEIFKFLTPSGEGSSFHSFRKEEK